jgi:hypothetical protein
MTSTRLPPSLQTRIAARLRDQTSPTRREALRRIALVLALVLAGDTALFYLFGGAHAGTRSALLVWVTQLGSALLSLAAMWAAFGRGGSMLGRSRRWLTTVIVATPIALFGWSVAMERVFEPCAMEPRVGWRCLGISLSMTVWALPLLGATWRERNPIHPALAGAARGVAAGALTWLPVGMWCPRLDPAHLAVGHVLPLVLLGGYGAWLGRRMKGVHPSKSSSSSEVTGVASARPFTVKDVLIGAALVLIALLAGYASAWRHH